MKSNVKFSIKSNKLCIKHRVVVIDNHLNFIFIYFKFSNNELCSGYMIWDIFIICNMPYSSANVVLFNIKSVTKYI